MVAVSGAQQQPLQIFAIFAAGDRLDQAFETGVVDIALAPGDFLQAGRHTPPELVRLSACGAPYGLLDSASGREAITLDLG